ncbi:MAG: TPM domain-containing protein [Syntrophotalea acetylenica]|nr:TPM domain-containing protein [Syntrophotalea acetylenica]
MRGFLFCVMLGLALLLAACGDRYIDDRAGLMSADEEPRLRTFQKKLLQELDIELQVVVLDDACGDLDSLSAQLVEQHGIGKRTRGTRGVLLLVDPVGRQVRMEIGYDLEGIFPDAFIGYIEQRQMAPFFEAGRLGAGIEATAELVVGKALGAIDEAGYDPSAAAGGLAHLSGGGGARSAVDIGIGVVDKPLLEDASAFGAQSSPEQALEAYLEVLRGHIKDPGLGLYSPETQDFFRQWLVTDAQQDNERRKLESHIGQGKVFQHDGRAVIRFPLAETGAAPYFLVWGDGGWMLDFASMHKLIGFNHRNQWHLRSLDHNYMFGFVDWRFDRHGFPCAKP